MAENDGNMQLPIGSWINRACQTIEELAKNHLISRKVVMVSIGVAGIIYLAYIVFNAQNQLTKCELLLAAGIGAGIVGMTITGLHKQGRIDEIERIPQEGEIVEVVKPGE